MKLKKLQIVVLGIVLVSASMANGVAGDKAVTGLIIGAGSGAMIGMTGQNTNAILLGTAVGGVVGYAIGDSLEHSHRTVYRYGRPHHDNPSYNRNRGAWHNPPRPHYRPDKRYIDHRVPKRGVTTYQEKRTYSQKKSWDNKRVTTTTRVTSTTERQRSGDRSREFYRAR
ncbi:MAG: glycine zipper family protein [Desulfopila sp.]